MERKCSTNVIIFTLIVTNKEEWTHEPLHQKSGLSSTKTVGLPDFWYDFIFPKYFIVFKKFSQKSKTFENYKILPTCFNDPKMSFSSSENFFIRQFFLHYDIFFDIFGIAIVVKSE